MATLKATLTLELNGVVLPNFPKVKRLTVAENQSFSHEEATGGGYVALPASELDEIQAMFLETDQQVTIRLDGQTDAGIVLNAGGMLLLFDVDIDAGAGASNASVDNASGSTVNLKGTIGGT